MAFTFKMILSGLMAVIPDRPRFLFAPIDSLTVLLPNLQRPRIVGAPKQEPDILDSHYPFLVIPSGVRLPESTRRADLVTASRQELFHLLGEEIEIVVPGGNPSLVLEAAQPLDPRQPSNADRESLYWLATVEEAAPGFGVVNPALVTADLTNDGVVATRLRINTGRFFTHGLSERSCRFEPEREGEIERPYAVRLALEIEVKDRLHLSLTKEGDVRTLEIFQPDGVVEIHLINREFEDILNVQNLTEEASVDVTRPLADFDVFYGLTPQGATLPANQRRFLKLVPRKEEGDNIEVDPPHALCPPTGLALKVA